MIAHGPVSPGEGDLSPPHEGDYEDDNDQNHVYVPEELDDPHALARAWVVLRGSREKSPSCGGEGEERDLIMVDGRKIGAQPLQHRDWRDCRDPQKMLEWLRHSGNPKNWGASLSSQGLSLTPETSRP